MQTAPDISKLPKWTQDHIASLQRQRDAAIVCLNRFEDHQTPSKVYTEELVCTGERQGPTNKRHWIQTETITCVHAGIELRVSLYKEGWISLSWGTQRMGVEVAFIPEAFQQARLQAELNK